MKWLRLSVVLFTLITVLVSSTAIHAQYMEKIVSVDVKKQPVGNVLKSIGKQAGFYFSYNSNIINKDSLVTITAKDKSVRYILDALFDGAYDYIEKGNHIIVERSSGPYWYVSGYVRDERTGEGIREATVYEKKQLVSTMTNEQGYYRLKLKDRYPSIMLSISKSWYLDREIPIRPGVNQEVNVSIAPKNFELDSVVVSQYSSVEKTWLGKLFLSSRQKVQSINLGKFFVDKPYQTSFIPGLSTHGRMGAQVVNKFSLNVVGGYTAGVNGFELGAVFNIVKQDVKYVQVSGAFNVVGGKVEGLQIAGIGNGSLDSVNGLQFAGLANMTPRGFTGAQFAGLYNHVGEYADGVQVAGLANYVQKDMHGTQIAGLANITIEKADGVQIAGLVNVAPQDIKGAQVAGMANVCLGEVKGVQASGMVNVAKTLTGLQFGIVNFADSSDGYSLGLLNIILKGYHKLSISANEMTNLNAEIKTGSHKFYSILIGGMNIGDKAYVFGYGFGREMYLNKTKTISLNPEISTRYLYPGNWDYLNIVDKLNLNLNIKLNKYVSVFAGPSYSVYWTQGFTHTAGYKAAMPAKDYGTTPLFGSNELYGWVGGNIGVSIF